MFRNLAGYRQECLCYRDREYKQECLCYRKYRQEWLCDHERYRYREYRQECLYYHGRGRWQSLIAYTALPRARKK